MAVATDVPLNLDTLPELLTDEQLEALGIARRQTLANWRCTRRGGPPFIKLGGRIVRYRKSDVVRWLQQNRVDPTPATDDE